MDFESAVKSKEVFWQYKFLGDKSNFPEVLKLLKVIVSLSYTDLFHTDKDSLQIFHVLFSIKKHHNYAYSLHLPPKNKLGCLTEVEAYVNHHLDNIILCSDIQLDPKRFNFKIPCGGT